MVCRMVSPSNEKEILSKKLIKMLDRGCKQRYKNMHGKTIEGTRTLRCFPELRDFKRR